MERGPLETTDMPLDRRGFLLGSAAGTLALGSQGLARTPAAQTPPARRPRRRRPGGGIASASRPTRSGSSRTPDLRDIEECIDLAADMGFDGVEILHRQMDGRVQRLPATAQAAGVRPRPATCAASPRTRRSSRPTRTCGRRTSITRSSCIELAYAAGHPDDARQHRHLGHEQELRRPDEKPRHRAAPAGLHRRGRLRLGDRRLGRSACKTAEKCGVTLGPGEPLGPRPHARRASCGSSTRSIRRGCR